MTNYLNNQSKTINDFYQKVVSCKNPCTKIINKSGTDWIPRGFYTLCKENRVKLLIIAKNPSHIANSEKDKYENKSPDEILLNHFKFMESFFSIDLGNENKMHRNLLRYLCYLLDIHKDYLKFKTFMNLFSPTLQQQVFQQCVFTNLVKCSTKDKQAKLSSYKEDANSCFHNFLQKEIELFNPRLILCLGGEVFNFITKNVNTDISIEMIKHPSYFYENDMREILLNIKRNLLS